MHSMLETPGTFPGGVAGGTSLPCPSLLSRSLAQAFTHPHPMFPIQNMWLHPTTCAVTPPGWDRCLRQAIPQNKETLGDWFAHIPFTYLYLILPLPLYLPYFLPLYLCPFSLPFIHIPFLYFSFSLLMPSSPSYCYTLFFLPSLYFTFFLTLTPYPLPPFTFFPYLPPYPLTPFPLPMQRRTGETVANP